MKNLNINSSHVYWFIFFIFTLWCAHLVWKEHLNSLFFIVPILIIFGARQIAWRWELAQKRRLLARYQSIKMLFAFFFLMAVIGVIATFCFSNEKIHLAPFIFLAVMLSMAGDLKRYGRWVKKKSTLVSA